MRMFIVHLLLLLVRSSAQSQFKDSSGVYSFIQDVKLEYKSSLSAVGTAIAVWSDSIAVSAIYAGISSNSYRPFGIVFLLQTYPGSDGGAYVDTGLSYQSGVPDDGYGSSLAMNENILVVGAPADSRQGIKHGAAYINSGNKLQTAVRLLPHDDDNCAYFGSSVAATVIRDSADSDLVVVGSYGHYNNGHFENSGTVYLYSKRYNTYDGFSWQLERRIKPSDHEPDSFFGKSVSASGTILAVGSPGEGKVFVYRLEHRQQKDDAEREREEHEREEHEREGEGERQEHMRRLQDKEQEKDDERDKDHENAEEEREEREREEQERQEQEEHEREERLHEEEREAEWNVEMILSISSRQSNHHQEHTNLNFGCSVSVFNSSVTSIAIGASNDGIQSSTGGAYVISMPRIDHLYSEWRPHLRRRTQGHEEGENEGDHEHEEGEHEHNGEWILSEEQFSIDKSGNYWILENSMYGSNLHEQFGSNVYMGEGNIAVGGAGTSFQGKVLVYSREASATGNSWSSVVVRGPLHNKAWQHISTVYNGNATAVDHFGSSFGLTKDGKTLVVGNSYDGGGGTYIFSSTAVSTEEDTNDDTEVDVDTPVDSTDDPTDESVDLPSGEAYSSSESTGYNFSLRKIVKSVWLRRKYIAWGCAVILLVALHAKIRHYVYIRNKKNKKKRVNSLNDIDLSTNSASPMMDSSTRSSDLDSSNSVEMTYTGALQAHSTPIPQSRGDSSGIRKKSLGGRLSKSQYENRGVTSIYDGTGGLDHENLSSGQQLLHSREGVSRKNRVLPPQTYPQQSEQHYSRDDAGMNDYHYGVGPTSPPHFHHGNFHDPTRPPREMRPNHRNYNRHDGAQFDYAQQRQATSSKSLRTARTTSSHKASQYYS